MKNTLFIFLLLFSSFSYAHDYFFAFAEIEYDELKQELQTTLIVSTHDINNMLREKNIIEKDLSTYENDKEILKIIQNELSKGFSIRYKGKTLELFLEGMENQLTGLTNFYFTIKEVQSIDKIEVKFDLLMNEFSEQQNKLTFQYRNSKRSYIFLQNKIEQEIILLEK